MAAQGQQPPLTLTVDRDRYEIPDPLRDVGPEARFEVTPAPGIGDSDEVELCRNGRFDRGALARGDAECSGDLSSAGSHEGRQHRATLVVAGLYETVAIRIHPGRSRSASNVVSFVAVDPCLLTADLVSLIPPRAWLRGEPIACQGYGYGRVRLRGVDGSSIALAGQEIAWGYHTNWFRPMCRRPGSCTPVLQLIGYGRRVDNIYRIGARLGQFVTVAGAPYVAVGSIGPAQVSLVHRNRATRVRVGRGNVVVFHRLEADDLRGKHILRVCPQRPTLRCLKRLRYRRGQFGVFKGKPMRAGQSAVFRR